MKDSNVISKLTRTIITAFILIVGNAGFIPVSSVSATEDFQLEEITVDELLTAYSEGDYTAEEVVQLYLDRTEQYEGTYNAFTVMNPDALEEAREIDRLRSEGADLGPLAGVPVVIKEAVDMAGFPTTFGWAPFSEEAGGIELIPTEDAPVVTRLKEAGAIILGRTNIPAFSASGTHANTSWAGPTYSAVNRSLAPGGSSSGTATSVSGNLTVLGIAEETGGSIQNPAAAQAIVGIKPSFGLVPTTGVTPLAGSTRDVLGPHARTVADAARMLDVMAGYSEADPKTELAEGHIPESYTEALSDNALEGKRLGLYGPGWRSEELTAETQELYDSAIEELESQGAEVVTDPFAGTGFAEYTESVGSIGYDSFFYDLENYLENLNPEDETLSIDNLFGQAGEVPWTEEGPLSFLAERGVDIEKGLANPDTMPDLTDFEEAKAEYLQVINEVMAEHDLDGFVFPQMSKATPLLGDENIGSTTVPEINMSGLPLITVPAGYYEGGSPFALAFFGEMWSEAELIGMAYDYEQATNHRIAPQLVVEEMGEELADTATSYPINTVAGILFILIGAAFYLRTRLPKTKQMH